MSTFRSVFQRVFGGEQPSSLVEAGNAGDARDTSVRARGGIRDFAEDGFRITLDLREQVLRLSAEPHQIWDSNHDLLPTLPESARSRSFVSASMLAQKAKQFDDGLYAAVELAAQNGIGPLPGKAKFLPDLADYLLQKSSETATAALVPVLAACELGGVRTSAAQPLHTAVQQCLHDFRANQKLSHPLGFYTWSRNLTAIFQQDRLLQMPLRDGGAIEAVLRCLRRHDILRDDYERILGLADQLTNPPRSEDFRALLRHGPAVDLVNRPPSLFPPSRSHEGDLAHRLFEATPIPEGFSLVDALIGCIRSGDVLLTPNGDSGWYDYQTWALEPLVVPERMPEAKHLELDPSYRQHLLELFRGLLAMTRETHVKQVGFEDLFACGLMRQSIMVSPNLTVEPLPSYYRRRAISYGFIRGVLEQRIGPEGLRQLQRLRASGNSGVCLGDELAQNENLFWGAYITSMHELGLDDQVDLPATQLENQHGLNGHFAQWRENVWSDADLQQDVRMMVPLFFDRQREQMKVLVLLGWSVLDLAVSFARPPDFAVQDTTDQRRSADVQFCSGWYEMAHPVTAEVYVGRVLDRDEFRAHCDRYQTREGILGHLR
jgi:hypothetical protein